MTTRILAALATFFISSTALAWAVPVHMANVSSNPSPAGDPIPCSYTNEDGQTFNGVVSTAGNNVMCVGLVAPDPKDETAAASIEKLFDSLDEPYDEAPMCHLQETEAGTIMQFTDEGDGGEPVTWAAVKVCGPGWCHELLAYDDCNDYNSTEIQFEGVTCYDLI